MFNQFYNGIKVKNIIDVIKPKLIVEIGIGNGENVMIILSYLAKNGNNYKLVSISESPTCPIQKIPLFFNDNFFYLSGISYNVLNNKRLPNFPSIDICIIDSDHNYYTLKKELASLYPLLSNRSVIIMHDMAKHGNLDGHHFINLNEKSNSTFEIHGLRTGAYLNGEPYPFNDIFGTLDIPMMKAVEEFISEHNDFRLTYHTEEMCGITILGRNFDYKETLNILEESGVQNDQSI